MIYHDLSIVAGCRQSLNRCIPNIPLDAESLVRRRLETAQTISCRSEPWTHVTFRWSICLLPDQYCGVLTSLSAFLVNHLSHLNDAKCSNQTCLSSTCCRIYLELNWNSSIHPPILLIQSYLIISFLICYLISLTLTLESIELKSKAVYQSISIWL